MTSAKNSDPLARLVELGGDEPRPQTPTTDNVSREIASSEVSGNARAISTSVASDSGGTGGIARRRRTRAAAEVQGDSQRSYDKPAAAANPDAILVTEDTEPQSDTSTTGKEAPERSSKGRQNDVTVGDAQARAAGLEELTPALESARVFAERWEERYRPYVFRVALDHLLGRTVAIGTQTVGSGPRLDAHRGQRMATVSAGVHPRTVASEEGERVSYERLAQALEIDFDSVERLVKCGDDGRLHILARVDGRTKKELQTKYSLAYLYVKEVALGERMVDIEELRSLCVEHACYDLANFTGNFGKDVAAGLLRQQGEKGARSRKFLLSKKGLDEAAALLRQMANQ